MRSRRPAVACNDVFRQADGSTERQQSLRQAYEESDPRTVVDLVAGSGIRFIDRGIHKLKGVPERWQLYAAHVPDEAAS